MNKQTKDAISGDVKVMGLAEFERRSGFRPRDAYEKFFFAATGARPSPIDLEAIRAGLLGQLDEAEWNMGE